MENKFRLGLRDRCGPSSLLRRTPPVPMSGSAIAVESRFGRRGASVQLHAWCLPGYGEERESRTQRPSNVLRRGRHRGPPQGEPQTPWSRTSPAIKHRRWPYPTRRDAYLTSRHNRGWENPFALIHRPRTMGAASSVRRTPHDRDSSARRGSKRGTTPERSTAPVASTRTPGGQGVCPPGVGFARNCKGISSVAQRPPLSNSEPGAGPLHQSGWIHHINQTCTSAWFEAITNTGQSFPSPRALASATRHANQPDRRPAIGPARYLCRLAAFADPEHLGPANRAHPLSRWPTIFHGNGLGVPNFPGRSTLHTIAAHINSS